MSWSRARERPSLPAGQGSISAPRSSISICPRLRRMGASAGSRPCTTPMRPLPIQGSQRSIRRRRRGACERPAACGARARARRGRRLARPGSRPSLVGPDAPTDARLRPRDSSHAPGGAHPRPRRGDARSGCGRGGAARAGRRCVADRGEGAGPARARGVAAGTRRWSESSFGPVATPRTSASGCGGFRASS